MTPNHADNAQFREQGFLIVRNLAPENLCSRMRDIIASSMDPPLAPVEFETDVQYPGSPTDRLSPGGDTPRRLLHAYTRDAVFRQWATSAPVVEKVRSLLGAQDIALSQNHHNCVMTKHPGFSSATLWHQDIRYWLFDRPDLVSVWLALGDENDRNGGVWLIPGTHRQHLERGRFDGALFFRQDIPENQATIETAVPAELACGDTLFFHSRTLHAANRNRSGAVKLSVVFTYRDINNHPLAGTRSAAFPDIPCPIPA